MPVKKLQVQKRADSNILTVPFCQIHPVGLSLPDNLDADQWLEVGLALGRVKGVLMWAVGDWWAFGEHRYGERAAAVKSEDWEGPAFGTCANAAWVCQRFETSLRSEVVSFGAHKEIAPIEDEQWRLDTLAWAANQKPTILALRQHVKEVKAHLAQGWTVDQSERKKLAEEGHCVVANLHDQTDTALVAWAEATDRFVRIDRATEWGNPFEIPADGAREEVVGKFAQYYLPHKNGLLKKIPELRGKVLGCWCHPEDCHGHVIAKMANEEDRQ
jgi:hypothetical protein